MRWNQRRSHPEALAVGNTIAQEWIACCCGQASAWELFDAGPQTFKLHLSFFLAFVRVSNIVGALRTELGAFMGEGPSSLDK